MALMVTIAEQLRAEGRAIGMISGRAEVKAESLILLLNRKFGSIPIARLEQIGLAKLEHLDPLIRAVRTSENIDEVFHQVGLD